MDSGKGKVKRRVKNCRLGEAYGPTKRREIGNRERGKEGPSRLKKSGGNFPGERVQDFGKLGKKNHNSCFLREFVEGMRRGTSDPRKGVDLRGGKRAAGSETR